MFIEEIYLKNFRNYKKEKIRFQKKINIILGKNGQGKTNLLEGIYILSMGKSFRTNIDSEMINFNEVSFCVKGTFFKNEKKLTVEMNLKGKEKLFKVDGIEKRKNADLLENVYTVVFSPEDLKIIKEEPEYRRKFIDRQLFQLKSLYYKNLAVYKKILKNRNSTLKESVIDEGLLDVWDDYLIETGSKIMMERMNLSLELDRISSGINSDITNGKEKLKIKYEPNIKIRGNINDQKEEIRKTLKENRSKDIERRTTTAGPHKDDIKITIDGEETKKFGSQGQQRTAALSLKLAELKIIKDETGEDAILILDDVMSELDRERQKYLISSFNNNQIFISAAETGRETLERLPGCNIYTVEKGSVKESNVI